MAAKIELTLVDATDLPKGLGGLFWKLNAPQNQDMRSMKAKKQAGNFVWNQNFVIIAHKEDIPDGHLGMVLYEKGLVNTDIIG